jgi:hypothetical protein
MHLNFCLKKHLHILAFHQFCEAIPCDCICSYNIDGNENPADILTKHHSSRERVELMKPLVFWAWRE